ncbi:hypothetical protein GF337_15095 [candidate division KSB1 bacterium]|nr:hypothetical protein [candidate division KSB1 bacterium]
MEYLMKKFLSIILLINFIVIANLYPQQVVDKIVAIVDDDIILQSELLQFSLNLAFQYKIDPRLEQEKFAELQDQVLDNMINQKILLAKAEEDTIEANEREVENVLDSQIERMIQQLGSVEKLEEYLGSSLGKIRRDFRGDVEDNLKVESLKAQKMQKIQISRREVEHFYETMQDSLPDFQETVDISHILLTIKPGDDAETAARKKIIDIAEKLRQGEDFVELAKKYSEDPGSKTRGGELGFFKRGEFVREFEEAAFALQEGEISDIVKSEHGYHIIQMIERRGERINVRHILVRLASTQEDASRAEKRINEVYEMLQDSQKDFAEIAEEYSEDETTNEQGGHLGKFTVEDLQEKEFKRVVKTLEQGEVSKPFRTRFGWHVLKLNERQEARKLSINKDWEQIEQWALSIKQQEELNKWLEELKMKTYVEVK